MGTIMEALNRYEEEFAFAKQLILPEEDRVKYTSAKWAGGFRWFRSPNVVCLDRTSFLRNR